MGAAVFFFQPFGRVLLKLGFADVSQKLAFLLGEKVVFGYVQFQKELFKVDVFHPLQVIPTLFVNKIHAAIVKAFIMDLAMAFFAQRQQIVDVIA